MKVNVSRIKSKLDRIENMKESGKSEDHINDIYNEGVELIRSELKSRAHELGLDEDAVNYGGEHVFGELVGIHEKDRRIKRSDIESAIEKYVVT